MDPETKSLSFIFLIKYVIPNHRLSVVPLIQHQSFYFAIAFLWFFNFTHEHLYHACLCSLLRLAASLIQTPGSNTMASYYSPLNIHLSRKVWWHPLHGACTPRVNVPMTTIKKTPAFKELGPGSHQPKETKKTWQYRIPKFCHHTKQWPLTTLHLKSISPRRFGDIPSMVLAHPELMSPWPQLKNTSFQKTRSR